MELPLDASSLEKPTADLVRHIYEALVSTFLGVTRCRKPWRNTLIIFA